MIRGNDILDPTMRKAIMAITVVVMVSKLVQTYVMPPGRTLPPAACREKRSSSGSGSGWEWATVEMQGWRPAMEDAVCVVPSLPEPLSREAIFAVFDGHGGSQVSRIASQEFAKVLVACATNLERLRNGGKSATTSDHGEEVPSTTRESCPTGEATSVKGSEHSDSHGHVAEDSRSMDVAKLLHVAMLSMDQLLRRGGDGRAAIGRPRSDPLGRLEATMESKNAFNLVGSTALVAMVCHAVDEASSTTEEHPAEQAPPLRAPRVAVANCGDSRAVLCRAGRAVELSRDHKPELQAEEERIRRAGGLVAQAGPCHRVDGWGLNLSRALGDFHYKARSDLPAEQQKVIAVPEIRTLELEQDDEFVILGCDGIFELNTSQCAVDIVRTALAAGLSLEAATQELVDRSCSKDLMATRGRGGDNCSAVVFRRLPRS
eukprot:SRR837773.1002.p1 GENE.SRR837773.1002~~SRR837773.1002.p1  ORF type:complete len:470 (+),score=36.48 SRR837773.1002:118-1410(+)